jgi:hypothetical protein
MQQAPLGWEYESRRVLEAIENVRLSSDATLKSTNEMRVEFARLEATFKAQSLEIEGIKRNFTEEIEELKTRLDRAQGYLMTIGAALIIYVLQHLIGLLKFPDFKP